jgi:hypothetical protein
MSKISLPGFTAEASLYKTNDYYPAVIETIHASGVVQPARGFATELADWVRCLRYECRYEDVAPSGHSPIIVWHCGFVYTC